MSAFGKQNRWFQLFFILIYLHNALFIMLKKLKCLILEVTMVYIYKLGL